MSLVSNIHIGLAAWAGSHAYALGTRVSNGGAAYQVTTAGTSAASGGPSGTGTGITDGSVTWKWLSAIDYTSAASWVASIPSTLTQPIIGQLWNNGVITVTTTALATLSGHTTSATNTITLRCAPGESFSDNPNAATNSLYPNQANGVYIYTNTGYGAAAITGTDQYVTVQGLQFYCAPASAVQMVALAFNCNFIDNIYCGNNGGTKEVFVAPFQGGLVANNLFICNTSNPNQIVSMGESKAVNNTVVRPVNYTTGGVGISVAYGGTVVTNNVWCGCTTTSWNGAYSGRNNASENAATFGALLTNNVTLPAYDTTVFVQPNDSLANPDFRTVAGSPLIGAGYADTTDLPAGTDILGTARGSAWDIGAYQKPSSTSPTTVTPGAGTVALTGATPTVNAASSGTSVAPGAGTVALTGKTPAVAAGASVTTGSGTVAITGKTPAVAVGTSVTAGAGTVALTGKTPAVAVGASVATGAGAISLSGATPVIAAGTFVSSGLGTISAIGFVPAVVANSSSAVNPGVGTVAATGNAPTVTTGITVALGAGTVSVSGSAPTVVANATTNVSPGAGAITLAGSAPTVSSGTSLATSAGTVTLSGAAPTLAAGTSLTSSAGTITATGNSPTITAGSTATPGAGTVALTGFAPAVSAAAGGSTIVSALLGTITVAGAPPTLSLSATVLPGAGAISATGFAPHVDQAINPSAGSVALSGKAPTIAASTLVLPSSGAITAAGFTPTVTAAGSGALIVNAGAGAISLSGQSPALTLNVSILPSAGSISLTGFLPNIVSGVVLLTGGGTISANGHAPSVSGGAVTPTVINPGSAAVFLSGLPPLVTAGTTPYPVPVSTAFTPFVQPCGVSFPASRMDNLLQRKGVRLSWAKSHTCPCVQQGNDSGGYNLPGGAQEDCLTCAGLGVYWDAFSAPFNGLVAFGGFMPMPSEPGQRMDEKFGLNQNTTPMVTVPYSGAPQAWTEASTFDQFVEVDTPVRYSTTLRAGVQEALPFVNGLQVPPIGAVGVWNQTTKAVERPQYTVTGSRVAIPSYAQGTPYAVDFYACMAYVVFRTSGGMPHARPFGGNASKYPRRFTVNTLDWWLRKRDAVLNPPNWSVGASGATYPLSISTGTV